MAASPTDPCHQPPPGPEEGPELSARLLVNYEMYEHDRVASVSMILAAATDEAYTCVQSVVSTVLDAVVEKEYRKQIPDNVTDAVDQYLLCALELHFKRHDQDEDRLIKQMADPDDEPERIPMDTWSRANINTTRTLTVRPEDPSVFSQRIPDYKEVARREIKQAKDKAEKYLTEVDETRLPKVIPLNEKVEEMTAEEQEIRRKKERQIKEEKDKKKREEEAIEKLKEQERMISQAVKKGGGEMEGVITYGYDGQIIISNAKSAKEKLNNVILPTKTAVKKPESDTASLISRGNIKLKKDKASLPSLKKNAKVNLMEDLMARTYQTAPNISDVISLNSGVTLIQNGRTKSSAMRLEHKFDQTGTLRMNKTSYSKMLEQKKQVKMFRLGEMKRDRMFSKKFITKKDDLDNSRRDEQSEVFQEDQPFDAKAMKGSSKKLLNALIEQTAPDQTLTTFNNTITSETRRRMKERLENYTGQQDQFLQTQTDVFNLELMRGNVDTNKRQMSNTHTGSIIQTRTNREEANKLQESKHLVIPRNRSQRTFKPGTDVRDLMSPPVLGGYGGHDLFTSKTHHNFFKPNK